MHVDFEFEGQPYSAEVDNGRVVMLRLLRREVNGQLAPVNTYENPEQIEGALQIAREAAQRVVPPTVARRGARRG